MNEQGDEEALNPEWDEGGGDGVSWLSLLFWLAVVSGLVWITLNAYVQIRFQVGQFFESPEAAADEFAWAQVLTSLSYTLFLVSVGIYVLLWLRSRTSSLPKSDEGAR